MRRSIVWFLTAVLLLLGLGVALAQEKDPKAQTGEAPPAPIPPADAEKKNPVKSTPEGLVEAKRLYKYHCAMSFAWQLFACGRLFYRRRPIYLGVLRGMLGLDTL